MGTINNSVHVDPYLWLELHVLGRREFDVQNRFQLSIYCLEILELTIVSAFCSIRFYKLLIECKPLSVLKINYLSKFLIDLFFNLVVILWAGWLTFTKTYLIILIFYSLCRSLQLFINMCIYSRFLDNFLSLKTFLFKM